MINEALSKLIDLQTWDKYGVIIDHEKEKRLIESGEILIKNGTFEIIECNTKLKMILLGRHADGMLRMGYIYEHDRGEIIVSDPVGLIWID
jgi:S-adenosylmethionine synthetase